MTDERPRLYELTRAQVLFSGVSIVAALLLLGALGVRIVARVDLWQWWVPLALAGGVAAADFGSGLVHWGADTWGRDDLPVIGHRLLVPFRVHHINPDDFIRRRFMDTNGDVAFIAAGVLGGFLAIPLEPGWGEAAAVFGFGFCGVGMMTNQIHQWAHLPSPPRLVRALQACGMLLGGCGSDDDQDAHKGRTECADNDHRKLLWGPAGSGPIFRFCLSIISTALRGQFGARIKGARRRGYLPARRESPFWQAR